MKAVFYAGLSLSSFGLVQVLGFFAKAYPWATGGSLLLVALIFVLILCFGVIRVSKMASEGYYGAGYAAWSPTIAIVAVFCIALLCGVYIAG